MKKLLNPMLALAGTVAAISLTGCASNPGYSDVTGPRSALAFTSVTTPRDLINWSEDRYLMLSLRGMDTYYFQVPNTGYQPGGAPPVAEAVVPEPGAAPEGVGAAPGPYETETGTRSYKIIEYRPGHNR